MSLFSMLQTGIASSPKSKNALSSMLKIPINTLKVFFFSKFSGILSFNAMNIKLIDG